MDLKVWNWNKISKGLLHFTFRNFTLIGLSHFVLVIVLPSIHLCPWFQVSWIYTFLLILISFDVLDPSILLSQCLYGVILWVAAWARRIMFSLALKKLMFSKAQLVTSCSWTSIHLSLHFGLLILITFIRANWYWNLCLEGLGYHCWHQYFSWDWDSRIALKTSVNISTW